jgi:hypothetical protein
MATHFLREIDPTTKLWIADHPFWDDGAKGAIPAVPEVLAEDGNVITPAIPEIPAVPATPIPTNMISTPVPPGFGWPKWDGSKWVEGKDPAVIAAQEQSALIVLLESSVQNHLDSWAIAKGYDSIISACSYSTSAHPTFGPEGRAAVAARDTTWQACQDIMAAVKAGTHPVPAAESLIAELPALVWPT